MWLRELQHTFKSRKKVNPYIFWPDNVWSKHFRQVDSRHLVDMLIASSVIQQVKQQLQQTTIGWWEQHEKQLICLNLAFLVRHICLIPFIIKASQVWTQQRKELLQRSREQIPVYVFFFQLASECDKDMCVRQQRPPIFRWALQCLCVSRGSGSSPKYALSNVAASLGWKSPVSRSISAPAFSISLRAACLRLWPGTRNNPST